MRRRRALRKLQGLQLARFRCCVAGSAGLSEAVMPTVDRSFWMKALAEFLRLVAAAVAGAGAGGMV